MSIITMEPLAKRVVSCSYTWEWLITLPTVMNDTTKKKCSSKVLTWIWNHGAKKCTSWCQVRIKLQTYIRGSQVKLWTHYIFQIHFSIWHHFARSNQYKDHGPILFCQSLSFIEQVDHFYSIGCPGAHLWLHERAKLLKEVECLHTTSFLDPSNKLPSLEEECAIWGCISTTNTTQVFFTTQLCFRHTGFCLVWSACKAQSCHSSFLSPLTPLSHRAPVSDSHTLALLIPAQTHSRFILCRTPQPLSKSRVKMRNKKTGWSSI